MSPGIPGSKLTPASTLKNNIDNTGIGPLNIYRKEGMMYDCMVPVAAEME